MPAAADADEEVASTLMNRRFCSFADVVERTGRARASRARHNKVNAVKMYRFSNKARDCRSMVQVRRVALTNGGARQALAPAGALTVAIGTGLAKVRIHAEKQVKTYRSVECDRGHQLRPHAPPCTTGATRRGK